MAKNKYRPMKDLNMNPAITDLRDERASQDRKLLRIEAFKTTAMVLGNKENITMSEIINESNKVYAFLENGTTQPKK
jgi:hypothetical protein|tara:strand:- start:1186 stop:1416 length:231 start_codon:yes stop_codon:yes gene_type:complete